MTEEEEDVAALRTIRGVQKAIDWIRKHHHRVRTEDRPISSAGRRNRQRVLVGGGIVASASGEQLAPNTFATSIAANSCDEEEEGKDADHDEGEDPTGGGGGSRSSRRIDTTDELRDLARTVSELPRRDAEDDPTGQRRGSSSRSDAGDVHRSDETSNLPWPITLVDQVMVPLVEALARSYSILDHETSDDDDNNNNKSNPPSINPPKPKNRNQPPPPPPKGLLSLHQYADVAALVECVIVTAIVVPSACLEEIDVAATAAKSAASTQLSLLLHARAQKLPKSIVGRLSQRCLVHLGTETATGAAMLTKSASMARNVVACRRMRRAVSAVGQLLLLDRFKYMLLPRHLPDLYLGIFCLENQEVWRTSQRFDEDDDDSQDYRSVKSQLLPSFSLGDDDNMATSASESPCRVDAVWQARACQALLASSASTTTAGAGGAANPAWLRSSASKLLSHVAATDLPALLHVFVPPSTSSPTTSVGGDASLRLARAILAPPQNCDRNTDTEARSVYLQKVIRQVAIMLDAAAEKDRRQRDNRNHDMAGETIIDGGILTTLWALLDGMPVDVVRMQLGSHVAAEALVGRWHVLLSFVPPFVRPRKVLKLLLEVSNESVRTSVLMVLAQQATQDSFLHVPTKDVARDALHHVIQWSNDVDTTSKNAKASHLLTVAFLHHAVAVDSDESFDDTSMESSVAAIELRFRALVLNMFVPTLTQSPEHDQDVADPPMYNVVSFMFRLLLEMYLQNPQGIVQEAESACVTAEDDAAQRLRLVPLVALPIMCEECPLESLLQSSTQILELMSVTFEQAACLVQRGIEEKQQLRPHDGGGNECRTAAKEYATISGSFLFNALAKHSEDSFNATTESSDTIFTLCSLLLGVLIGILELGARKRCAADEAMFQTFPARLLPLARMTAERTADIDESVTDPMAEVPAELASMASHAIALILARQAPADETSIPVSDQPASTSARLSQCQKDLQSVEVPIRARAVVSLRHVACSLLDNTASTNDLCRVLHLLMESLKDTDSYVYLAAVQTIAFLADATPKLVLPLVGRAVAIGDLVVDTDVEVHLSSEQRVKLAEALVSSIRRKVAVHEYLSVLLDSMIYGGAASDLSYESSKENGVYIQEATHQYFLKGAHPHHDEPHQENNSGDEDRWDETDVRIRTGGPLFEEEENEVVRAAKLSVVTELVMASQPAVLSGYCHTLVRCSIGCLQQGRSRPIRRSGALLARELYAAAIREHDEQFPQSSNGGEAPTQGIPFTVAMVGTANEKPLALALERCLHHEDVNDLGVEQPRLADPATSARCQEALQVRAEAEETGILAAGRLLAESEVAASSQPLLQMLTEPSRNEDPAAPSRSLTHMIVEM